MECDRHSVTDSLAQMFHRTRRVVDLLLVLCLLIGSVDRCQSQSKFIKTEVNKILLLSCGNLTSGARVSWKKGNQPFENLGPKFSMTGLHELMKTNVSLEDEGDYSCIGVGKNNVTIMNNFTVFVLSAPEIKVYPENPKTVREGNPIVQRMCKSRGRPQPTIEWFTNKQQRVNVSENSTSPSERIYVQEEQRGNETISFLKIKNVSYTDNGLYTCFAINEHSTVRNTTLVNVVYSPKPLTSSNTTKIVQWWEGAKVSLTCTAEGNPTPKLTWSNETDLNCSVEHISDYYMNKTTVRSTCWVQVADNSSFQGGNYSCFANNILGNILVQNFSVHRINPPPAVEFQLVRKTSNEFYIDVNIPRVKDSPPAEHVLIHIRDINSQYKFELIEGVESHGHSEVPVSGILPGKHYEISVAARNMAGYGARKFTVQWSGDKMTTTAPSPISTHRIQPYNITRNYSSDVAQVNLHTNRSSLCNVSLLSIFLLFIISFVCCQHQSVPH